ncbi:hypothetical protein EBU24_05790, partial [bacterium]|nr:hypothetical protein [bacterium]
MMQAALSATNVYGNNFVPRKRQNLEENDAELNVVESPIASVLGDQIKPVFKFKKCPVMYSTLKRLKELKIKQPDDEKASDQQANAVQSYIDLITNIRKVIIDELIIDKDTDNNAKKNHLYGKCTTFNIIVQPNYNGPVIFNDTSPLFLLKSLLEAYTILLEQCFEMAIKMNEEGDRTVEDFNHYIDMFNADINYLKKYINTIIDNINCDAKKEQNYIDIDNLPIPEPAVTRTSHLSQVPVFAFSSSKAPPKETKKWHEKDELNSPGWIKMDIDGKVSIYSYLLGKWICADKNFHMFAYDFVKQNNVPFDYCYIVWPIEEKSASVNNTLRGPSTSEGIKLGNLNKYFGSLVDKSFYNIILTTENITSFINSFKDNVTEFIKLLPGTTNDRDVLPKTFLQNLEKGTIYIEPGVLSNNFKLKDTHSKTNVPEYKQPDFVVTQKKQLTKELTQEQVFMGQQKLKIYDTIITILKSIPEAINPYPKEGTDVTNVREKWITAAKERTAKNVATIKAKLKNATNYLQERTVKQKDRTAKSLTNPNNLNLKKISNNAIEKTTAAQKNVNELQKELNKATARHKLAAPEAAAEEAAAAEHDGGSRKYPAKKYRFASRKHSKRCKT